MLGMPPPNVPALKPPSDDGRARSMREQMEVHRLNPACAVCHARMDSLGFALENFYSIGRWRTADAGGPVDSAAISPTACPSPVSQLLAERGARLDVKNTNGRSLLDLAAPRSDPRSPAGLGSKAAEELLRKLGASAPPK